MGKKMKNGKVQGSTSKDLVALKPRCWEGHPPFLFEANGKPYSVTGGTCYSHGKGSEHDIEVSLDGGGPTSIRAYPWNAKLGTFISFVIPDHGVPSRPDEFANLIKWLAGKLRAGKSVHVGCIGGHGRTGMVLAALYATMTKDPDAITYVRKVYCTRAVESQAQVTFLAKHFGIKAQPPSKKSYAPTSKTTTSYLTGLDGWEEVSSSPFPAPSHSTTNPLASELSQVGIYEKERINPIPIKGGIMIGNRVDRT